MVLNEDEFKKQVEVAVFCAKSVKKATIMMRCFDFRGRVLPLHIDNLRDINIRVMALLENAIDAMAVMIHSVLTPEAAALAR